MASSSTSSSPSSPFPPQLTAAAEEVAHLLRSRHETISVAETAAGGLVSASLLATPGASRFYKGGLTLYTLESRVALAGWTQADIDAYDGPTPKLVEGLARHVRKTLKATYCVGESGTAGPTPSGQSPNRQPPAVAYRTLVAYVDSKERGYVALAVVGENGALSKDLDTELGGDRQANMVAFAVEALGLVKEYILQQ
ncbi:hypothetical protein HRR78_007029 [Exophiala dermatitidis]|nr:hypothetical protein HRR75_003456 [Exophiala dermatitidis]KAJ4542329.1 hypothetical protein HRR78_007029 [Exophiala dermatitidis]